MLPQRRPTMQAAQRTHTPSCVGCAPKLAVSAGARCRVVARASTPGEGSLSTLVTKAGELCKKQGAKLQRQFWAVEREFVDGLTPKSRGDSADWLLMSLSIGVFTFMSMHLYRLYAFAAYPHMFH